MDGLQAERTVPGRALPQPGATIVAGEPRHIAHFEFDSARVSPADVAALRALRPQLENRSLTVIGYTDATGPTAYNHGLALRRARAVEDVLVAAGLPATAIHVEGRGSCCYRASNAIATGRAANRRAELFMAAPAQPSPAEALSDSPD